MRARPERSRGIAVAVAVLLAAGAAEARKKREPAPDALIPVTVACATPGASIFVDGEMVGMTPLDLPVPVTPGDHTIKVTRLGFAPYIDVFSTSGKRAVTLGLELVPVSGVLRVTSNVAGARVLVDGKYLGDAPLEAEVDAGRRAVQLQKGGYRSWEGTVETVAGQEQALEARLEELPAEINPYKPPPAPPPRWYQKKWVWATVAGGALLVAGTVTTAAILSTRSSSYYVCDHADVCY
jgi:hypothetical protein